MLNEISGHTQLVCLLGSPVSHSISPAMHNEAFSYFGLDYAYLAFETNQDTLASTVATLKNINARGFNLTMPNKNKMSDLCDHLTLAAQLSGSVNTVVNDNGVLTGHTTDGIGFLRAAKDAGFDLLGKKMVLLGAGGASTAIFVQAALDGVSEIAIFSRRTGSYEHAQEIITQLRKHTSCHLHLYDYSDLTRLKESIDHCDILVNGTNVGMSPAIDACVIPDKSYLHKDLIVADIIYNPRKTKLLSMANACGCHTFNGMYMLLYQGAEAFKLWTKKDMPIEFIKNKFFKQD
ncbi:MAG: shikimate dehydrogenase [Velocimicrobium sp.]